eukprot:TRINITY_DN982_c0_g1_i1.p1 TRINITY_DN982_c0_g1~~TRINITY_DN982_c0_g1_i1.p1  ORF type:complete len:289 (+),score=107.67 TRINITY_DN982_c0_g1_i1:74-940(+)
MAFWGCVLKPGSKQKIENPEGDILHLSQACLHNPQDGKNYVQAIVAGKSYSIACLEKGKKEHDSFDLFFNPQECSFSNAGKSEVHLTGYFEPDEGAEESESEAAPVATKAASPKASPKVQPKSPVQKALEAAAAAQAQKAASPKASPKKSPAAVPAPAADDSDDEDLEEELLEEGEEEEMLEESEEEAAPPPKAGDKRKASPAQVPASPAKKAATAPAAAQGSPKAKPGGEQAAYIKKLHDYLKQHGKTSVSLLGSKVPRPKDAPKMKAIFDQNKNLFVVAGQDVSAK